MVVSLSTSGAFVVNERTLSDRDVVRLLKMYVRMAEAKDEEPAVVIATESTRAGEASTYERIGWLMEQAKEAGIDAIALAKPRRDARD